MCRSKMSKLKSQIQNMTRGCEWRHAPEAHSEDFGRFEKSQSVEFLARKKTVEIETLARPDEFVRYGRRTCWGGADGKVSIERWYLSPYVEKTFRFKGNKKFRTWTKKSSSVFCVSGFLCYVLCIHVMNILCTFHVSVSWVCYKSKIKRYSLFPQIYRKKNRT